MNKFLWFSFFASLVSFKTQGQRSLAFYEPDFSIQYSLYESKYRELFALNNVAYPVQYMQFYSDKIKDSNIQEIKKKYRPENSLETIRIIDGFITNAKFVTKKNFLENIYEYSNDHLCIKVSEVNNSDTVKKTIFYFNKNKVIDSISTTDMLLNNSITTVFIYQSSNIVGVRLNNDKMLKLTFEINDATLKPDINGLGNLYMGISIKNQNETFKLRDQINHLINDHKYSNSVTISMGNYKSVVYIKRKSILNLTTSLLDQGVANRGFNFLDFDSNGLATKVIRYSRYYIASLGVVDNKGIFYDNIHALKSGFFKGVSFIYFLGYEQSPLIKREIKVINRKKVLIIIYKGKIYH